MKKNLLALTLMVLAACLAGCIVIVDEETRGPKGRPPGPPEPTERTIAEIDAVSKLTFDSDKQQGYKRIAARAGISPDAQVHLVEATFARLVFDNSKEDLILTLIGNPSFSEAAEQAILKNLDRLPFDNTKQKILRAISARKG
jgi:hypothetical protein